ncbi:hypothetical protein RRF57_004042 [Xylaria bambusicola]|uniref:Uncharacterized protein n=1 Tax=Xylaria bambusicola TaxID=326684 RepID=A0AAN7Z420_9PEZI
MGADSVKRKFQSQDNSCTNMRPVSKRHDLPVQEVPPSHSNPKMAAITVLSEYRKRKEPTPTPTTTTPHQAIV